MMFFLLDYDDFGLSVQTVNILVSICIYAFLSVNVKQILLPVYQYLITKTNLISRLFSAPFPIELDMCLWNTNGPGGNKVKSGKILKYHTQGHVLSGKCEQLLNELTVQVWLLYDHWNFKYCTLYLSRTELRTNRWADRRTTIRLLDAPGGPFRLGT